MGRRIVALAHEDPDVKVVAAVESEQSPFLGKDVGELAGIGNIGVNVTSDVPLNVDVVIDFSLPAGLERIAQVCLDRKIPLVAP